ncbi:alpha/beta hydrolase [uncultured Pseudodesulfovibrio sp.]|uniref:alpha/beta fold hydrolase n=1 Tax=uncultured Pseudodesulfovibrio sp. TaxID=2035858 RepID=UPI0029C8A702|nr:alpha/beta hydrolase [uncultured Pseudodesulfovibrio sp.]
MDNFQAIETKADNHVAGWVTTTDSAKLWVEIHGQGRPVVLIHGWTMSSRFWRRQLPLADHFQIITVNLRGHGKSQSTLRGQTVPRYARDVRDVIRSLHLDNILLMGWSMGGCVVLDYWQQYGSANLSALGLVESCPAPLSAGPWNVHNCRENNLPALRGTISRLNEDRESFGTDFIHRMFISGEAPDHALKWMLHEQLKTDTETAARIYEDYVQRDYTAILPTIDAPTIVVHGRSRHMCFGPSTGRFVAGSIPNARFVILEKSGHMPFYEEADAFNAELTHFLEQHA